MYAADNGHERVVELLLQRSAEVNLRGSNGGTALMAPPSTATPPRRQRAPPAAGGRGYKAVRTEDGKSALQMAKEKGLAECVEAFRQHIALRGGDHRGVDCNQRPRAGGRAAASARRGDQQAGQGRLDRADVRRLPRQRAKSRVPASTRRGYRPAEER